MKATKEFFESLRTEVQNTREHFVVSQFSLVDSKKSKNLIDIFSGIGGFDINDAKVKTAVSMIEERFNAYEAEIKQLKIQLQKIEAEIVVEKTTPDSLQRTVTDFEDLSKQYNELVQQLEEERQKGDELREALYIEQSRHEANDGEERLPIGSFIEYAENFYTSAQNDRAKVLKEAILDIFDRRKISEEDYQRCRLLGTKESPTTGVVVSAGGINVQQANNVGK